jgi:hypothetical protein
LLLGRDFDFLNLVRLLLKAHLFEFWLGLLFHNSLLAISFFLYVHLLVGHRLILHGLLER